MLEALPTLRESKNRIRNSMIYLTIHDAVTTAIENLKIDNL
jgi:hypothetical protein